MSVRVLDGDCRALLATLPAGSVQTCVTSPPYFGLRDYGVSGQIGLEATPDAFVAELVSVFREVRRVLRDDGTVFLNLGDSYAANGGAHGGRSDNQTGVGAKRTHEAGAGDQAPRRAPSGIKPKDLIGIPWMTAFALRADGWYLRSDIIWHKPNPMPESVTDRPTKAHEYLFLLAKSPTYFYDADAIAENATAEPKICGPKNDASRNDGDRVGIVRGNGFTRNRRTVWTVATQPFSGWLKTSHQVRVEADDADDDTTRTESPDCPLHGDSAVRSARAVCGEHAADASSHTTRSDARPAGALAPDSAPTVPPLDDCSAADSSDSILPASAPTATGRSTRTSRTGRAPATTPACTASAQTSFDTDGTLAPPESVELSDRTPESNTEPVDSPARLSAQTVANIASSVSPGALRCTCAYHKTIYKDTSHFATFPPALIEPCILAGSRRGDVVLDPFGGAGTTGLVADRLGRDAILCELNPTYAEMARRRITDDAPLFGDVA